MQINPSSAPSGDMMQVLQKGCSVESDCMSLESFIRTVLYHPEIGYYRKQRLRVGRKEEADFFTSASMGRIFARLVISCVETLLPEDPGEYVFVEAGPETAGGIIGELESHPFASSLLIKPQDALHLPDKCVVFSNELFDAQPFRRLIFKDGVWKEMGVRIADPCLEWVTLDLEEPPPELPAKAPEGYLIDWPQQAFQLLQSIASQSWQGLFIAFDYGLDSETIFNQRPAGTGRTYSSHKMGSDLLERPGEIDITCHVIWDLMENILKSRRFTNVHVYRQEAFLMQFAQPEIQRMMETGSPGFSLEKQSLMQLIHPGNMGHKFQVLTAQRCEY